MSLVIAYTKMRANNGSYSHYMVRAYEICANGEMVKFINTVMVMVNMYNIIHHIITVL